MFRDIFKSGVGKKWRFNQSSLYLDFLAGNQQYQCTPWGNPTRNVFGWQKPCYLLVGEGYAPTFKALMEETEWQNYGNGRNPKCANCMVHSGYEASAVEDAIKRPWKALKAAVLGPGTSGDMTPELPVLYDEGAALSKPRLVAEIKPAPVIIHNDKQDKQVA